MKVLKKKRAKLRKELKNIDKKLNKVKKSKRVLKDKLIVAEKIKLKILGKVSGRRHQKRGTYKKTKLKKIWLPPVETITRTYELNDKGWIIVRFD